MGAIAQKKFYDGGGLLPSCVNDGCINAVTVREWKNFSMKSECGRCERSRKSGELIPNVKIHKKTFCANKDGHLGFKCPVKISQWKDYLESLDLDHKDGDHMNNTPSNVETYCKLCHNRKSKEEGDWNSNKPSGRSIE